MYFVFNEHGGLGESAGAASCLRGLKEEKRMIYFAGAGCGAADLITVRGMKLLEKAVVVI